MVGDPSAQLVTRFHCLRRPTLNSKGQQGDRVILRNVSELLRRDKGKIHFFSYSWLFLNLLMILGGFGSRSVMRRGACYCLTMVRSRGGERPALGPCKSCKTMRSGPAQA